MFVVTLVRNDWKESEKAMKCARGSAREQQLTSEEDTECDETIHGEPSQGRGDILEMNERESFMALMSEKRIKDSEQGKFCHC